MNLHLPHDIVELDGTGLAQHLDALADLLLDSVQHGSSVGFCLPYSLGEAREFWQGILQQWQPGARRLLVLRDADGMIVGTVQLLVKMLDNGRHRAEVSKMLVHSKVRRQGRGRALMMAIEACAREEGKSLLVLDTRSGDAGERLYGGLGFQLAGRIPGYARASDGGFDSTTYMYKFLGPLEEPAGRIVVAQEDPLSADADTLMDELSATLALITGDSGRNSFDVADVQGDAACFAIARNRMGIAVGCGAFRPLAEGVAEIKRMLARPGNPGTGTAVLAFLEQQARELGYRALWLETRLVNSNAVQFYESRGYSRRENYGKYKGNAQAVCMEKNLI